MTEETEPGLSFLSLTAFRGSRLGLTRHYRKQDPIVALDDEPEDMVLSALLQASQEELSFIIPRACMRGFSRASGSRRVLALVCRKARDGAWIAGLKKIRNLGRHSVFQVDWECGRLALVPRALCANDETRKI